MKTCKVCNGKDCVTGEGKHELYSGLSLETCYWCVFKGGLEPTNRGPKGWEILGWKVADGLFFAFETVDGEFYPIHITCFCCLADAKARTEILEKTKRWWFMGKKSWREYPNPEIFRQHYPNLFQERM